MRPLPTLALALAILPLAGCPKTTACDPIPCPSGAPWDPNACACVPADLAQCVEKAACVTGSHWDATACMCVADAADLGAGADRFCVDNVLCVVGSHWDPVACTCVQDPADLGGGADRFCVDNVLCIVGTHWDPVACKCVPVADAGGCHLGNDPLPCSTDADCAANGATCSPTYRYCVCN